MAPCTACLVSLEDKNVASVVSVRDRNTIKTPVGRDRVPEPCRKRWLPWPIGRELMSPTGRRVTVCVNAAPVASLAHNEQSLIQAKREPKTVPSITGRIHRRKQLLLKLPSTDATLEEEDGPEFLHARAYKGRRSDSEYPLIEGENAKASPYATRSRKGPQRLIQRPAPAAHLIEMHTALERG